MKSEDVLRIIADGKCPVHPRWQKKRKPTSGCQNCWFIWIMKLLVDGADINFGEDECTTIK